MKAGYQKLPQSTSGHSFNEFWVKTQSFGFHWHYHPEIEICYVKQGRGKRIIGDNVSGFSDGDLVLVGSNVPHSWITDELFNQSDRQIQVYVIHLTLELLEPFEKLNEFKKVKDMLNKSPSCIEFKNPGKSKLIDTLLEIENYDGFEKYLKLMELLNMMSSHEKKSLLCSNNYKADYNKHHEERILKVCNYIHDNYKNTINTEELSNLVSMNPSAFCRFFKGIIGKTVVEYINELRIGYVCNQLQHTSLPMYKIAFDAGFSSVAYFNRVFRKLIGKTPREYRALTIYGNLNN